MESHMALETPSKPLQILYLLLAFIALLALVTFLAGRGF
jgi:hypothetical protein